MSKAMVVTLPFVLLLLDYWPLNRLRWEQRNNDNTLSQSSVSVSRLIIEKIPLFILAAISCVITWLAAQNSIRESGFPLNYRISNALVSYVNYIAKMAFPLRLAVFYPHLGRSLPMWRVAGSFLILAGISAGVVRMVRRRPFLAVGWLWYLGTLVPVIGLVQAGFQAMADRYTYLPSIGIFIIVAWGAAKISARWRYRKILLGVLAGAVLIPLLLCTRRQVRYWQNGVTLFEHALKVTQNNYVVHDFLALAYQEQGQLDKQIEHYRKALQIRPDYIYANNNLGKALQLRGNLEEAINHYRLALQINDNYAEAHNNLGVALSVQGNLDEAITHFRSAIQFKENFSEAYCNLGNALILQGKTDEAQKYWNEALRFKGGHKMHANIASILAKTGKFEKALFHWTESLRLNPNQPMIENVLAETLYTQGNVREAIEHWSRALQLKPNMPRVLNNLAWIMATHPDKEFRNPAKAVGFAERSCELTGFANPESLDTLSAAYAANGKFNEAVQTAQKAEKMFSSAGLKKKVKEIQNRLELYKTGRPYREEL
jgi:tetratricopeptide (TPR) repeat protein